MNELARRAQISFPAILPLLVLSLGAGIIPLLTVLKNGLGRALAPVVALATLVLSGWLAITNLPLAGDVTLQPYHGFIQHDAYAVFATILFAAGAGLVVVKNGGGEMLTLEGGATAIHAPETAAQIVDTTAAGDSFNAGFLADWLTGGSVASAVRAGAKLAAYVIGKRGALCELGQ